MPSLITELKREVLDPAINVSTLLRKVLIVSKELGDKENEKWIAQELKGYGDEEPIPECRELTGRPMVKTHYHGWQTVYTQNLSAKQAHDISTFNFRSPMAEIETNASQDYVGITYHPEMERLLIKALGGEPSVPAIQFTGIQFQRIVDTVRDKLTDWVTALPEPEEVEEQALPEAPRYSPNGLRGIFSKNKEWAFQGIGTEVLKGLVYLIILIGTFVIGYYWPKKQVTQKPVASVPSPSPTVSPTPRPSPEPSIQAPKRRQR